jgi:hypothetical protein
VALAAIALEAAKKVAIVKIIARSKLFKSWVFFIVNLKVSKNKNFATSQGKTFLTDINGVAKKNVLD